MLVSIQRSSNTNTVLNLLLPIPFYATNLEAVASESKHNLCSHEDRHSSWVSTLVAPPPYSGRREVWPKKVCTFLPLKYIMCLPIFDVWKTRIFTTLRQYTRADLRWLFKVILLNVFPTVYSPIDIAFFFCKHHQSVDVLFVRITN